MSRKQATPWGTRKIYEFIAAHRKSDDVKTMCSALGVTRSGFFAWLKDPVSRRAQDDARLLRLIRASFRRATAFMARLGSSWI
jgi:putative transposase